jgi:hypothetical protein
LLRRITPPPRPPYAIGNSKALVEEEKFRKSGKRKFEQISEKLLEAAKAAQLCSYECHLPLDISSLSSHGQDLLRGKIQERTELMHLHTITLGAKRWSGEQDDGANATNYDDGSNVENLITSTNYSDSIGTQPTPGKRISRKSSKKDVTTGTKSGTMTASKLLA